MNTAIHPDGVSLETRLPFLCEPLPADWQFQLEGWMHANHALLAGLAAIETAGGELEHDFDPAKQDDRIEAKLNLALHLIGQLMSAQAAVPPAVDLILSASGVAWRGGLGHTVGEQVLLCIVPSSRVPQALKLPARIAQLQPRDGGAEILAQFEHLSEPVSDWLDRTLFRRHRREIHARHFGQGN